MQRAEITFKGGIMFDLLFLLLLLSSSATIDSKCIGTFKELEKEIISNDENLHSLLEAFFPTNQYPSILVEIQYYINSTDDDGNGTIPVHPLALQLSNNNIPYSPDYTFYWTSSSVFIYFDYRLIQALSFYLLTFEPHFAYIVIPEFCSNITNNTIMKLINAANIWMKFYAVDGQISFEGVVEHHLQGYSYNTSYDTAIRVFLVISLAYFFLSSYVLGLYLTAKYYKEISKICNWGKTNQQKFRFKSIFWAAIFTIFLLNVLVQVLWLVFVFTLDDFWGDENKPGTYKMIPVISLMMVCSLIFNLFFSIALSCYNYDNKCSCSVISFLGQAWAIWTVTTTAITLPVLVIALMLRILISPEQVFAAIMVVLTGSLTFGIYITFVINHIKYNMKCCQSSYSCLCSRLNTMIIINYGLCLVVSIIIFSIHYVQSVLFSGVDNIETVNGAGHLFMALLLAFIVWRIKKEYDKFITDEEENAETNDETAAEVPNTPPHKSIANPTFNGTNEETPLLHTRV